MLRTKKIAVLFLAVFCVAVFAQLSHGAVTDNDQSAMTLEEKTAAEKKLEDKRELEDKLKREAAEAQKAAKASLADVADINEINLPVDTTPVLEVRQVIISGNTLVTTEELLADVPQIYNASDKPIQQADSARLYDFRVLRDVILNPGQSRQVSTRTINAFNGYLVAVYQKHNYAGVQVSVPQSAMSDGKLQDQTLAIRVVEIPVSKVKITSYDVERNVTEQSYLRKDIIAEWSPVETGEMINKKKLDDFINILNLNPDRYITATVSEGNTPGSIAVGYDIFEVKPWHYFIQMDNAGTPDSRYNPRLGVINTNLTGRDDKFTAFVQGAPEKGVEDNYAAYASYDFPLWTPRLRLKLFGGRSEYEVNGGGGIDFLGHGSFYGGELRLNVLQHGGWFFDVLTSLSQQKTKVTSTLFPQFLGNQVTMNLWSQGVELYRRNDISSTLLKIDHVQSIGGGSGQSDYWDAVAGTGARTNSDKDFEVTTYSASHSLFLDDNKVQRLLGNIKYISPDNRLVPAKMTTFGGMYTVRGYKEDGIVADGGLIASVQYEYDLVKKQQAEERSPGEEQTQGTFKKLAPLVFCDCGRAKIKNAVAGEESVEELASVGTGVIVEIGENFNGAIYYGWPLRDTSTTKGSDGRLNLGLMFRW